MCERSWLLWQCRVSVRLVRRIKAKSVVMMVVSNSNKKVEATTTKARVIRVRVKGRVVAVTLTARAKVMQQWSPLFKVSRE